jgi:hypothetical protein
MDNPNDRIVFHLPYLGKSIVSEAVVVKDILEREVVGFKAMNS